MVKQFRSDQRNWSRLLKVSDVSGLGIGFDRFVLILCSALLMRQNLSAESLTISHSGVVEMVIELAKWRIEDSQWLGGVAEDCG